MTKNKYSSQNHLHQSFIEISISKADIQCNTLAASISSSGFSAEDLLFANCFATFRKSNLINLQLLAALY
uniref:Uncharacterized protein n=1 Tax=Romanomermis culicivorax TaxID=13658 RepID=A0A915K156_ROMCU